MYEYGRSNPKYRPAITAKRRVRCTGRKCTTIIITYADEPLCRKCRARLRRITCPLCGGTFDPWADDRRKRPTCRTCRKLYRRSRNGSYYPLLGNYKVRPQITRQCTGCGTYIHTNATVTKPMCHKCRADERMRNCILCGGRFDRYESCHGRTSETCPECRLIYRKKRVSLYIPLLKGKQ